MDNGRSNTQAKQTAQGGSLALILTIVFVVLKLTGVITWSWLWVLAPLWISFLVGIFCAGLSLVLMAIITSRAPGFSKSRKF